MPDTKFAEPVQDDIPKVDDTIAVGEDLEFQKKWWRFEHATWIIFGLLLLADVFGAFGRGYLSKAELRTSDQTLFVKYERVERASTPSIMTVEVEPAAVQDGKVQLFVSQSLIKQLGNQRISPQPASSVLNANGITYTFPVSSAPAIVEFAMQPSFPGIHEFALQVPGFSAVHARVAVVP